MKKQILAMSILAALSGCDLDNKDALKVPATFENTFTTEVGFFGTEGNGYEVQLTSGHGTAEGTLIVNDVNYGEAEPDYDNIPVGKYGTFTLEPLQAGYATWKYDLREEVEPGQEEVQAEAVQQVKDLIADPTLPALTETLTITTLDGTKRTITFVIAPVPAEAPTEIQGDFNANADIRNTSTSGTTSVYDPHFGQSRFKANATFDATTGEFTPTVFDENGNAVAIMSTKGFGSLLITEQGNWEFTVNPKAKNPDDETQTLKDMLPEEDSAPIPDTVTITTADGTTATIDVNIYGAVPNFAAKVLSTTTDDSLFDVNMANFGLKRTSKEDPTTEGKMVFKLKITEDLAREAVFSMACSSNFHSSENRRVAAFYIKPDGELSMWSGEMVPGGDYYNDAITGAHFAKSATGAIINKRAVFDQRLVPGEWSEFSLEWKDASETSKPKLKASLNGEILTSDHGAIPTDTSEYFTSQTLGGKTVVWCIDQMRFEIKPNEAEGGTGALLVDDIQYYTDINAVPKIDAGTKAHLNESFANNQVGDVVKDIVVKSKTPYVNADATKRTTTDNVLIDKD